MIKIDQHPLTVREVVRKVRRPEAGVRVEQGAAATDRTDSGADRRHKVDRRSRRGQRQLMDRRSGAERRRSSIDLSI